MSHLARFWLTLSWTRRMQARLQSIFNFCWVNGFWISFIPPGTAQSVLGRTSQRYSAAKGTNRLLWNSPTSSLSITRTRWRGSRFAAMTLSIKIRLTMKAVGLEKSILIAMPLSIALRTLHIGSCKMEDFCVCVRRRNASKSGSWRSTNETAEDFSSFITKGVCIAGTFSLVFQKFAIVCCNKENNYLFFDWLHVNNFKVL